MPMEQESEEEPVTKNARIEKQVLTDFIPVPLPERHPKFLFRAIVDEKLASSRVPLIGMHAVRIDEGRAIAKVLPLLSPLPAHLGHLKRIYQGAILIISTTTPAELTTRLQREISEAVAGSKADFFVQNVPALKARTRAQFEFAKQHWPSTFHEDKGLESKLSGSHFDDQEVQNLSLLCARVEDAKGALIYDPIHKRVIVDVSEKPYEDLGDDHDPLAHPAMRCIDQLADQQASELSEDSHPQYLATGFDIILHKEPCTMCAMALVHCRARRVFFAVANPELGALVSRWRLQEVQDLNHHYEVFQIIEQELSW